MQNSLNSKNKNVKDSRFGRAMIVQAAAYIISYVQYTVLYANQTRIFSEVELGHGSSLIDLPIFVYGSS